MYEAYTSQEFADIFEKQPDQSSGQHAMVSITAGGVLALIGLAATVVWLPIFVIAGPPVGVYKAGKLIKSKFKKAKKKSPESQHPKRFITMSEPTSSSNRI